MASVTGDFVDFSGKAVLITGAATGTGRAAALGLARRDAVKRDFFAAQLALAQAQLRELQSVVQIYRSLGGRWQQ